MTGLTPFRARPGTPDVPGRHVTRFGCKLCGCGRATRRGLCAPCRGEPADRCSCGHPRALHPRAVPRRPAYVTAAMLRARGACEPAVRVFERWWGSGVVATPATARFAEELGLPLRWVADYLVTTRAARVHRDHRLAELTPRIGGKRALRVAVVEALAVQAAQFDTTRRQTTPAQRRNRR